MPTMSPPPTTQAAGVDASSNANSGAPKSKRSESFSSQKSDDSQTAADFIHSQMQLEADAREALPYSIENCTKLLGPLRQNVFACLTCTPPPANPSDPFEPAGVCYACSIQCHGEHTLVEIFTKRNFTCDCGTKRLPKTSPCTLRINTETNTKGGVHSEEPDVNNKYNQNFRNRFCGCECDYDPFQQKGTMFQCLGLGTAETGGCGEDWYHPGCLVGMGPNWFEGMEKKKEKDVTTTTAQIESASSQAEGSLPTISEDAEDRGGHQQLHTESAAVDEDEDDDPPMPPGFPAEDDFDGFLCNKCVDSNPWIKKYAGQQGFLLPVYTEQKGPQVEGEVATVSGLSNKRKAEDDDGDEAQPKRLKTDPEAVPDAFPTINGEKENGGEKPAGDSVPCAWAALPTAPEASFSLFFKENFRERLCRCSECYVGKLNPHPQLLEEEETYEPPLSDGGSQHGGSTNGSGSLLERGESALRNVDRVRAIEGVMAYNHLKEQLKPFFQKFADSGEAIGAEDIKAYFAKLRGDDQAVKDAGEAAGGSGSADDGNDSRKEQSGY